MSGTFRHLLFAKLCFIVILAVHCKSKRRGLNKVDSVSGIDLLKDLTFTTDAHKTENLNTKGVTFMDMEKTSIVNLKKIMRKHEGEITTEFIGYSNRSSTTLLGIYLKHKPLPLFELSLDINHRRVIVRYQGERSFQRLSLKFGKILENWTVLSATISRTHFTVTVGCREQETTTLRQPMKRIPKRAIAVLASGKQGENRFTGQMMDARLYPRVMDKADLLCSKPVNLVSDEGYMNDIGADIHLSSDITPNGDRILLLEQQITQLNKIVNTLKMQNKDLTARVVYLESCDCYTECTHDGEIFDEGQTWNMDECTVCICKNNKADCLQRTDIPSCQAPCSFNPCLNSGRCVAFNESQYDVACMCQPPFDGPTCEFKENPCVWQAEPGICDQWLERFYYDRFVQECLPFNYTGCGGNLNNYETLDECEAVAVTGSCCYREYSLKVEDVIVSQQNEQFGCKDITLSECQATHRQVDGDEEMEVISFYPGVTCAEAGCGQGRSECSIDGKVYGVGEKVVLGCQACTCESSGQFVCSCSKKAVRKEIRDMTQAEISQFQAAIQQLRLVGPGNPWEEFRDIYMRHTMHSNGGPYFLPWHRVFLRRLEQKLQSIDCSITLPYFDFTTDVGNFADAIIWQPNYFGGDGIEGCVPDHPFGLPGSWRPCIMRQFNSDVKLPSLIELAMAIASDDYTEMSMALESYVSYVHTYIGGDMATRAASYDPVFYSIHAYIDMLYWWWQQKGSNMFTYPAAFANIPMVPFNIPPSAVLDLEADLCVLYSPPSKGHPCNASEAGETPGGEGPRRGDITPDGEDAGFADGFNSLGYNTDGYDRRGFDVFGYRDNGFTRDDYSRQGYDRDGYDRYGYDADGYSRHGYNIGGFDRDGVRDMTERYNANGYDRNCLNRKGLDADGYDQYGYRNGYNREGCNYYFTGPFSTSQSMRVWGVLRVQTREFLMTLTRTCPGVTTLPSNWLQQFWITNMKDVTGMLTENPTSSSRIHNSPRFCFDLDSFVTSCGCDEGIATCTDNPCVSMACPSYPEASCSLDFCGMCKPRWYVGGKLVDCFEERDFCVPNPCDNEGECIQSIWPTEPQLTTCRCPPGYDGQYCQYVAHDVCELPVSTGRCANQETRFYFNYEIQECQSFIYSGCGGNANNFVTRDKCESRCKYGACCHRFPRTADAAVGYDADGYDKFGFDVSGYNRYGIRRTEDNGIKTGTDRFVTRYDWQGYDKNGYNIDGYDRQGLDKSGYDTEGFNLTGYSRQGEYDGIIDYNSNGYDAEGYNRAGFTCHGTDRDGLDVYGVYADYVYRCRSLTLSQCQRRETQQGNHVVTFSRGKRCDDVKCEANCGCLYNNRTYSHGESFKIGCQYCTCTLTGAVECRCAEIYRRKEVRDMTQEEMERYQDAVKQLSKMEHPSAWFRFAEMFADYKPQAVGNPASLPWHRYFLRMVERELQTIDCSITIPYYDWTLNAGDQRRSRIWAVNKFGGNGDGVTGCVTHHPFKDYYPPYWAPCLRRQFDPTIMLPDTVDIQYALNEDSYDAFRLSMELYFNIFKLWVGGHMASDYAPYDPLYLSVAAFVDRIWWDWENKQQERFLAYPQEFRYVPMSPFSTTADDVMDSKKQMCVTYFPLTDGAVCNITQTTYGFNSAGYDRHGFDREGYDIDGYNVFGVDGNGKPDQRGLFNTDGFDRHGYTRSGYDSSGFDRFGFSTDNYNVDGYNPAGYDMSGYDRHGFDRNGVTSVGFHKNGTWITSTPSASFDRYGYNRYGRDRYGFDRQGYDVYGFDSMGYDRNRCNRYYLGPMLVIIKRWAEVELENVDDKTMRIITRICPAVSPLPEWRYTVNWLQRGDQLPLMEGILGRAQQRARALDTTSLAEDVKLGPDRSLCFVTYYYAECPFGKFPVSCMEDLCTGRTCPGYPDAVCRVNRCGECSYEWYHGHTGNTVQCQGCMDRDGIERGEGQLWPVSVCETCSCQEGLVSCTETQCYPPDCGHPALLPGQCCPSCDGCLYEGRVHTEGHRFTPAGDACDVCHCRAGTVRCQHIPCPDVQPCHSMVTLEEDCCPSCIDCGLHGNGSVWKESPCQRCRCLSGAVSCERIQCIPPDCSHPVTPPGECCPACDGCLADDRTFYNGETYFPDDCNMCTCTDGNFRCDPTPCPESRCRNPITPAGECCPVCDNECLYEGRAFRHGNYFLSPRDMCMNCSCDNSAVQCLPVTCSRMNLPCRRPITEPGHCCPTRCPTCAADGREYENGAMWKSVGDPCESCLCEEGITTCHRMDRCPLPCDHGAIPRGECCSPCTDCVFAGLRVRDGQTFVQPGDNCQQCTCVSGQVTCESLGPCPVLPCRVTETPPGACCPQCKRCDYQGRMFSEGDVVFSDSCSTCYCRDGEVGCERVSCPALRCNQPRDVPGECCPVCDECEYKGRSYDEGQRFTPVREPCHDCVCQVGEVRCHDRQSECPGRQCTHPIQSTSQCCPKCDGCSYLHRRFRNRQKFIPPGDDKCKICRCVDGSVTCMDMGCGPVECENAVRVLGQCCAVCPMGCSVMGIEYRDGQTFMDFMEPCNVCTCMMGEIRCMAMMSCEPTSCTHPARRPGNCCPSCTMCELGSRTYRNREQFTHPHDPCQQCLCEDGSIKCNSLTRDCPQTRCVDAVLDPSSCCPVCPVENCVYAGRQYQDGQEVPASRDRCEVCRCVQGAVECARQACPTIDCRHPGQDGCCQTCEECSYNRRTYALGETFPNAFDRCEDCICQGGTVHCLRRLCAIPNCSEPVYPPGECCPVCSGCTYRGIVYNTEEVFIHPGDPCENCQCSNGDVRCWKSSACLVRSPCDGVDCAPVTCSHPVPGDCCAECTDCQLGDNRVSHGQTYPDVDDPCSICVCKHGNISCKKSLCGPATCSHPTADPCGCPVCVDQCIYDGHLVQGGQRFRDTTDPCRDCLCRGGSVQCFQKRCDECIHAADSDECCPVCRDCLYEGHVVGDGETFSSDVDPCQLCVCQRGSVSCRRQTCPHLRCDDPVTPLGQCCPTCPLCEYLGSVYRDMEVFRPPSRDCGGTCVCQAGTVRCDGELCLEQCSHPVPGVCCPRCEQCLFEGRVYANNAVFRPDVCRTCSCADGNVRCETEECPSPTCLQPETRPDQCCPFCTDCVVRGESYSEGSEWMSPDNPCSRCTCSGGVVTCTEIQCYTPCDSPVIVPGQCCMVCPTCRYDGVEYEEGQTFSPNADPCDTCSCVNGELECEHNTCSATELCPSGQLVAPPPGTCCQSCATSLMKDCNRNNVDEILRPRPDDPCFYCQCQPSLDWVCGTSQCPKLSCPPTVQRLAPGQCCSECPACYDDVTRQYYHSGDVWQREDDCQRCSCSAGQVRCTQQACPILLCGIDEHLVTVPGQCCPECHVTELRDAECQYEGFMRKTGEEWHVDECTSCRCVGGTVRCTSDQCTTPQCGPDDSLSLLPGTCCPVCLPKPGKCKCPRVRSQEAEPRGGA